MPFSRLVHVDDDVALAGLVTGSRGFLEPWEPVMPAVHYTVAGQRAGIAAALDRHQQGTALPHVILDGAGQVTGRITLNGIVRGPFQSCSVGYWLGRDHTGRGLATAALARIMAVAFTELGLHRIQAETLVHNTASRRVLARCGFTPIGPAPAYLSIAGRWQDHLLFQALAPTSTGRGT